MLAVVILAIASLCDAGDAHTNEPADVASWDFSKGVYRGEVSGVEGDGDGEGVPSGSGNMTWEDGRTIVAEWWRGCPTFGAVHVPPRDKYE